MAREFTFGAGPEQLKRLLFEGLEKPEDQEDIEQPAPGDSERSEGEWIGGYKLCRTVGEGGMGIVYVAEQLDPIHRQVAIKVIKPGMDSTRVIARFEAERQTLALLDHPNIAHVFDAGTTDDGRPYFVMEYIQGLPITAYCDEHKLTIEQRLRLFQQICDAVQHAHQKGIIHRDIKPSNILVNSQDREAVSKIIDFGIAKAIAQPLTERTLVTEQGQLFGTPEYMSPEQADMDVEDIDTRSDIYSLGVLLYELLTGVLPFDSDTLREGGIKNIRQVICETDPKTPSTRLTRLGEKAKKIAENRHTEIAVLAKCLHRELEWIPLKAMRKERSERYRSASELADDIGNYLTVDPLIAGPPSTAYRLKKLVRRNAALCFAVLAAVMTLIIGLITTTVMYVQADHARAKAQAISDFLQKSITSSLNLRHVKGKEITVSSILDTISEGLKVDFQDQPLFEASILKTLVSAYGVLGSYELAKSHANRAIEIHEKQLGPENIATQHSRYQLGWLYLLQSRFSEAEPLLTKALASFNRALDAKHPDRLWCMAFLGLVYNYQNRFTEAERLFEDGLDAAQSTQGNEHPIAPFLIYGWSFTHQLQGRYQQAESLYLRGLKICRQMNDGQHADALFLKHGLGTLCRDMGRYDEAEESLQAALKGRREIWGEEHQWTQQSMADLGCLYHCRGQDKLAESLLVEALSMGRQTVGEAHICSLLSMHGLGTLYLSQGRYDQAEQLLAKALEIGRRSPGEESWFTLRIMNTLARLYTVQGRYEEADMVFQRTLATRRHIWDVNHPEIYETMNDMAVLYKEQGNHDKAEPLLLKAIKGRRLKLGDTHPHTQESITNLIDLYEAWNKPEKAKESRAKLPQIEAVDE